MEIITVIMEQGITASICGVFIYTSLKREEKLYSQMTEFKQALDDINKTLQIVFERGGNI